MENTDPVAAAILEIAAQWSRTNDIFEAVLVLARRKLHFNQVRGADGMMLQEPWDSLVKGWTHGPYGPLPPNPAQPERHHSCS